MSNKSGKRSERRLRVRTKRLKDIDNTKLSLALWLIAKGIVENKGDGTTDSDTEAKNTDQVEDSSTPVDGEGL